MFVKPFTTKLKVEPCLHYFDPIGHKISWTHHAGFPAVRANIAREMAAINGFEILFRVLRGPDVPWLGADTLSILLKAFSEVIPLSSCVQTLLIKVKIT